MAATRIVFWVALVAAAGLGVTLIATLGVKTISIWPPPGRQAWQYRLVWTLFAVACVGFLVVGGIDAGSLGLARWVGEAGTIILGSMLVVGGTALASYAMGRLGLRGCLGLNAELVTDGPFAVSRNPGYVGDLILIAGYVLLTDSGLAGIVGGDWSRLVSPGAVGRRAMAGGAVWGVLSTLPAAVSSFSRGSVGSTALLGNSLIRPLRSSIRAQSVLIRRGRTGSTRSPRRTPTRPRRDGRVR